ncbi:MAG: glycosyltransferase [Deltaproteobacteria bacterium]|nr:glycosyltransferase [Deltaproteobacteria bacterium]MDZ4224672.1 glycosyltransferase [bacterium]
MSYSVLIPTLNRSSILSNCLRAVAEQTVPPSEVIVIDQSDGKDTEEIFSLWNLSVPSLKKKYIHLPVKSLVKARNAGIDAATADFVWFLDDDASVNPEFAHAILEIFEKDTAVRYAGGVGRIMNCRSQRSFFHKLFLLPHDGDGRFLPSGMPTYPHRMETFCETEFLSGGETFWRRSIISRYRFDERLIGYGHGEDVDVSYRISRQYKNFYQPKARCFLQSQPLDDRLKKDSLRAFRSAWIQNFYYLTRKNDISRLAFFWCVLGYCIRDFVRLDFSSFFGDCQGLKNIFLRRIETVERL